MVSAIVGAGAVGGARPVAGPLAGSLSGVGPGEPTDTSKRGEHRVLSVAEQPSCPRQPPLSVLTAGPCAVLRQIQATYDPKSPHRLGAPPAVAQKAMGRTPPTVCVAVAVPETTRASRVQAPRFQAPQTEPAMPPR